MLRRISINFDNTATSVSAWYVTTVGGGHGVSHTSPFSSPLFRRNWPSDIKVQNLSFITMNLSTAKTTHRCYKSHTWAKYEQQVKPSFSKIHYLVRNFLRDRQRLLTTGREVIEILWGEVHSTYCSKYTLTIRTTVILIHASLDYFHTSKLNLPPKLLLYQSYTPITLLLCTRLAHFRIKNMQSTFLHTFTRCTCKQHTYLWR
jgi:hypothetical protein